MERVTLRGDRIRERRQRLDLSQETLAHAIGQDRTYMSKLERGVLPVITTTTLVHLAQALRCSTDYLLGLTDTPRCSHMTRPTGTQLTLV